MTIPVSALILGETSLSSNSATYERQHRPEGGGEDESDDWETIYCEEWLDGLDGNCVESLNSDLNLVKASED
jgi:hypothetical protein